MLKKFFFKFSLLLTAFQLNALPSFDKPMDMEVFENILVQNRILLKINGKPLTVMDVVRKLDFMFYRQYPELANSTMARYQFYTAAWKVVLDNVIDDYLILADAKEKEVVIQDGQIREELEKLFGPDVVLNLDKMGMTLEEASDLMKTELTAQRMISMLVRSKAMTEVNPQAVRKSYETKFLAKPPQDCWTYHVLTIKGSNRENLLEEILPYLKEKNFFDLVKEFEKKGQITLSEEYKRSNMELSSAHKEILTPLENNSFSGPIAKKDAIQIFYLKTHETIGPPLLKDVEEEIRQALVQEAVAKHNKIYKEKLRKQFGITENYLNELFSKEFEPFVLR